MQKQVAAGEQQITFAVWLIKNSNSKKNGEKAAKLEKSWSILCLCSDLVPVNPPTLQDEHYLLTVFIEPVCVCVCLSCGYVNVVFCLGVSMIVE